jgi:hypothetical protein
MPGSLRAFLDASVLYPVSLRHLLMRLTLAQLFQARWSATVHEEWIRAVLRDNPGVPIARLHDVNAGKDPYRNAGVNNFGKRFARAACHRRTHCSKRAGSPTLSSPYRRRRWPTARLYNVGDPAKIGHHGRPLLWFFRKKLGSTPALTLHDQRNAMDERAGDAVVTGYEDLVDTLTLPDPDARHVLAAAIVGQDEVIVTRNL